MEITRRKVYKIYPPPHKKTSTIQRRSGLTTQPFYTAYWLAVYLQSDHLYPAYRSAANTSNEEFSAGCQPRYPVKIPITAWKSLSPPRGLQLILLPARCPIKTPYEMESYPAPSAAQLFTMLLHRDITVLSLLYPNLGEMQL